jgi:hypothetical protein
MDMMQRSQEFLTSLDSKLGKLAFSINFAEDTSRFHREYIRSAKLGHEYLDFYLSEDKDGTLYLQWDCGLSCHAIERLLAEAHKEPFDANELPTTATIGFSYPDLKPAQRQGNMKFDLDKTIDEVAKEFLDEFRGIYLPYLGQFQTLEDIFAAMPLSGRNAPMSFGMSVHPRVIRAYIIFLTRSKAEFENFIKTDKADVESRFSDLGIGNYNFHINFLKAKYI